MGDTCIVNSGRGLRRWTLQIFPLSLFLSLPYNGEIVSVTLHRNNNSKCML